MYVELSPVAGDFDIGCQAEIPSNSTAKETPSRSFLRTRIAIHVFCFDRGADYVMGDACARVFSYVRQVCAIMVQMLCFRRRCVHIYGIKVRQQCSSKMRVQCGATRSSNAPHTDDLSYVGVLDCSPDSSASTSAVQRNLSKRVF